MFQTHRSKTDIYRSAAPPLSTWRKELTLSSISTTGWLGFRVILFVAIQRTHNNLPGIYP